MKFKKTSTLACALALVIAVGAMTAFAVSANPAVQPEQDDRSSHTITGMTYDSDNAEVLLVGYDESTDTATNISMEDAQSMEQLPLETGDMNLISVSHDDESKFTPEEWEAILQQIEQGTVYWED